MSANSDPQQDGPAGDQDDGDPPFTLFPSDPATDLSDEVPWGSTFRASRYYKGERFHQSLARHEHYLALQMQLRSGMRVLEVGCGTGRAAREIAIFTDAHVVGVTNNESQVQCARRDTWRAGLDGQVEFVKGDLMDLVGQFGENSFDAVYALGATCYAPSWEGIYSQIKKVLKPGGTFGVYEWCMTDAWNPSIPEHKELADLIAVGSYLRELRPLRDSRQAFVDVGFEIEREEDPAERPDAIPWYSPLDFDFRKAPTLWGMLAVWLMDCKLVVNTCIFLLEMIGLLSWGTLELFRTRKVGGDALCEGGQRKLFTPMYLVIAHKPKPSEECFSSNSGSQAHCCLY